MFSRSFFHKFNINYKLLLVPLVTSLPMLYARKDLGRADNKAYCGGGGDDEEKVNAARLLNHKLAKIEQKLDYLLEKESYRIDIKDYPRFSKKHQDSLLGRVLTEATWKRTHMLNTEEGFNINDVIQAGIDNPDHPIGLVAPSKDAYYTFEDILIPAASFFHNRNIRLTKYEKENFLMLKNMINSLEDFLNTVVQGIEISTVRNIEGFSFLSKISRSNRREVARTVLNFLKAQESEIFEESGKYLGEKAFTSGDTETPNNPFFRSCGFYRDWPDGRFFYTNNQDTLTLAVNDEDHIKIIQKHQGGEKFTSVLLNYFDLLDKIGSNISFCFDENLGYLTSFPNQLGSGTYFRMTVKLPSGKVEEFKNHFKNISDLEVKDVESKGGDSDNLSESLIEISNLSSFYNFSQLLIELITIKDLFKNSQ